MSGSTTPKNSIFFKSGTHGPLDKPTGVRLMATKSEHEVCQSAKLSAAFECAEAGGERESQGALPIAFLDRRTPE